MDDFGVSPFDSMCMCSTYAHVCKCLCAMLWQIALPRRHRACSRMRSTERSTVECLQWGSPVVRVVGEYWMIFPMRALLTLCQCHNQVDLRGRVLGCCAWIYRDLHFFAELFGTHRLLGVGDCLLAPWRFPSTGDGCVCSAFPTRLTSHE